MDALINFQQNLVRFTPGTFRRYLHHQIDWQQRMIAIKGPRGAGKTTLILQHLKFDLNVSRDTLYVTADHPWFYDHSLLETADEWYKQGGKRLFIDEVHKYPYWSRELKNIYDGYPELQVVFTASSLLDIYRGEADLSRRVVSYTLAGLSFREYLNFQQGFTYEPVKIDDLIVNSRKISSEISEKIKPLLLFRKYIQHGYLPIISEGEETYLTKLYQIINTTLENDLIYISGYNSGTAFKLKKLLSVIAESAPFKPNITALARKLEISRDSIYLYIHLLGSAKLLNTLVHRGKGVSTLQKPDKIFLENTNLAYALRERPEIGNLRETFLLNQLLNAGHQVNLPEQGDFLVNDLIIEVGGKNKKNKPIKTQDNYILIMDDLDIGYAHRIPLWLWGFLY